MIAECAAQTARRGWNGAIDFIRASEKKTLKRGARCLGNDASIADAVCQREQSDARCLVTRLKPTPTRPNYRNGCDQQNQTPSGKTELGRLRSLWPLFRSQILPTSCHLEGQVLLQPI